MNMWRWFLFALGFICHVVRADITQAMQALDSKSTALIIIHMQEGKVLSTPSAFGLKVFEIQSLAQEKEVTINWFPIDGNTDYLSHKWSPFTDGTVQKRLEAGGITSLIIVGSNEFGAVENGIRDSKDLGYQVIVDMQLVYCPEKDSKFTRGIEPKAGVKDELSEKDKLANRIAALEGVNIICSPSRNVTRDKHDDPPGGMGGDKFSEFCIAK